MTYELYLYKNDVRQPTPPPTADVWTAERREMSVMDTYRTSPDRIYAYTLVSQGPYPARFVVDRPFKSFEWLHRGGIA